MKLIKILIIWADIKMWCVCFVFSIFCARIINTPQEIIFTIVFLLYTLIRNIKIIIELREIKLALGMLLGAVRQVPLLLAILFLVKNINFYQAIEFFAFINCFNSILYTLDSNDNNEEVA